MTNKKTIIAIVLLLLCLQPIAHAETPPITPVLVFDKATYLPGDSVKMSLKLTGTQAGYKTNSVTFEIEYDGTAFQLAKGDPEKDIENGYLKLTTKNDVGKDSARIIRVMHVSMTEDTELKENEEVFSVKFKVKEDATGGEKAFKLNPVNVLDSSFNAYKINNGNEFVATVTVLADDKKDKDKKNFADIETHWAKNYIEIMSSKKIALGTDETHFSPDGTVTRAQFAAFLVRALSLEQVDYQGGFNDVSSSDWYAKIVATAVKAGIVKGTNDGTFSPSGLITREQMAAMIMRAYEYATGKSSTDEAKNYVPKFNDIDSISSWAKDSVKAANVLGIISGMTDTTFVPDKNATRAQAAKMVVKFLEISGLIL